MKILAINKFFYRFGGVESHYFSLIDLLEQHGHEVVPFAMQHPSNMESPWARFFVSQVDYRNLKGLAMFKAALRSIYSREARLKLRKLIQIVKPNISHLQHIYHQITPSIMYELNKNNIPIVQSLHDYKLVCPNYKLYIEHKNEICYRCYRKRYYNVILKKCINYGLGASLVAAIEAYLYSVMQTYYKLVGYFITPSKFLMERLLEIDIPKSRISVMYNFIDTKRWTPVYGGEYFLFVGRLVPEKGVHFLLQAAAKVKRVDIYIAGTGPEEDQLKQKATDLSNVRFLGWLDPESVRVLLAGALCVVVPSIWHDVAPLVIQEAYAAGKPVIGTAMGGIPELIEHEQTGLLVPPRDPDAMAEAICRLANNPKLAMQMGRAARERAETLYSPELYYQRLLEIYSGLTN